MLTFLFLTDFIFDATDNPNDPEGTLHYDKILKEVRDLAELFPGFKIWVTGHSLGAAVSTIASIYLATEAELPKPISNICLASPRNCTKSSLNAVRYLERTKQIRVCRGVNDDDLITTGPIMGYKHVGFQVSNALLFSNPLIFYCCHLSLYRYHLV